MVSKYMVHVRLSEFLAQCIHHYSKKNGITYQSIMTEALSQFMKEKLTPAEYQELLQFSHRKDAILDKANKRLNEDFFEYYDSLSDKEKKHLDQVYDACYDAYMKNRNNFSRRRFEDVPGFNELNENVQDRFRISIVAEAQRIRTGKTYNPDEPIDFDEYVKAWDTAFKLKEKEKKKDKNVKKKKK